MNVKELYSYYFITSVQLAYFQLLYYIHVASIQTIVLFQL